MTIRILAALAALDESGVRSSVLTPEQARTVEPGLNSGAGLHAAVHLPDEGAQSGPGDAELQGEQHARADVRQGRDP